jgi:hypothetical protein
MLCGKGMKPPKNRHWIGGRREPGREEDRRKLGKGLFLEETGKCGKTWS